MPHYPAVASFTDPLCPLRSWSERGMYSAGNVLCKNADPGRYVDDNNRTQQVPCAAGSHASAGGLAECNPCNDVRDVCPTRWEWQQSYGRTRHTTPSLVRCYTCLRWPPNELMPHAPSGLYACDRGMVNPRQCLSSGSQAVPAVNRVGQVRCRCAALFYGPCD